MYVICKSRLKIQSTSAAEKTDFMQRINWANFGCSAHNHPSIIGFPRLVCRLEKEVRKLLLLSVPHHMRAAHQVCRTKWIHKRRGQYFCQSAECCADSDNNHLTLILHPGVVDYVETSRLWYISDFQREFTSAQKKTLKNNWIAKTGCRERQQTTLGGLSTNMFALIAMMVGGGECVWNFILGTATI